MTKRADKKKRKVLPPTGVEAIDRLADLPVVTIQDYVSAASAYIREQAELSAGPKKASQLRLSSGLARALATELEAQLPQVKGQLTTTEKKVAGGLRTANADVSQSHPLDGLRLAVELKPINLAVGRAIWNRFGDVRTFAVNIHLKFPFAVVGGVLVIPTYEETGTSDATEAEQLEAVVSSGGGSRAEMDAQTDAPPFETVGEDKVPGSSNPPGRRSTVHLINRAVARFVRAGGRRSEAEAAHLLEGIAVVVYDPENGTIRPDIPEPKSGLRWEEFVQDLVGAYRARFED